MDQSAKLYSAEDTLSAVLDRAVDAPTFDFYGSTLVIPNERKFGDLDSVQRYVDSVLALNWVKGTWTAAEQPVKVRARKGIKRAHYEPLRHVIAIPDHSSSPGTISWAMREVVVLHELSHHLAGPESDPHGANFAGTMIKLLGEIMGNEAGLILTDAFAQNSVSVSYF